MTRRTRTVRSVLASVASVALALSAVVAVSAPAAGASTLVYDSIPETSPPSYASLGYEATSTDEFGDYVQLDGAARVLTTLSVGLTDWACENWATSNPCFSAPGSTFDHPITVNVYDVDHSGASPAAGDLIATLTETKAIPFRPSASPYCDGGRWRATDGSCNNGFAFTLDFDFTDQGVVLDDDVIVSVAYNTQHYGAAPTGVTGPYNSLNVSLADDAPTVGTDPSADQMFWKTTYPGYNDEFILDGGWTPYNGLVLEISTDPDLDPTATDVTVYQRDVKSSETTATYTSWHEGKNNATPAYSVKTDGLHLGDGAASTIIKGTDVPNATISKADLRAAIIGGASVTVLSGKTTFQVPVHFGSAITDHFTTLRSTSLTPGTHTFSLSDIWATTRAFGPYAAQEEAPLGELLDAVYGYGTVWLAGVGVQADAVAPAVVSDLTFRGTHFTFFQPEITPCTPSAGDSATNLDSTGWDFSQTRSQGSNVFTANGLHVTTFGDPTPSPDQRKAAGYHAIDIPLSEVGTPSIVIADGYTGVRPSLQLGFDADGNGTQDGYLVGEPWFYGGGAWTPTVNGDWNDAKFWAFADFGVGAGGGYGSMGTLNQYLLANPTARILSYGYSLGSGVNGDATIESISVGCSTTSFDYVLGTLTTATPTITGTLNVAETLTADAGTWGPSPVALTYQWLAGGTPIGGATLSTYVLTSAEFNKKISVTVTGTKADFATQSTTSAETALVGAELETESPSDVQRLAGGDRYETAIEISQFGFADGEPDTVYVATGLGFADALSAAPAAAHDSAPLLLTSPDVVPGNVVTELERLAPGEIIVVGGEGVVTPSVVTQLQALSFHPTVTRVAGDDRYATSRAIAEATWTSASTAYVAAGSDFPDALSAGPAAAHFDGPVVLVPGTDATVDDATLDLLDALGTTDVKIAGGLGVVSDGIEDQLGGLFAVTRNAGANRYDTAVAINEDEFGTTDSVFIATGLGFADALTGAALAGVAGAPLYVSTAECIPASVLQSIENRGAAHVLILGGTSVLSAAVERLERC